MLSQPVVDRQIKCMINSRLKVHKIENFFGSDFEFWVISLLVMLKYTLGCCLVSD